MASSQQVALTQHPSDFITNIPVTAQQAVPAFLQKLYTTLRTCGFGLIPLYLNSDITNNSLIKWSEAGDSLFGNLLHEVSDKE
jgi:hypothetical protein